MICCTDSRGGKLPKGSWKTICMRRRSGRSAFGFKSSMAASCSRMWPLLRSRRSSALASVVLPEPDSPTTPSVWPWRMCNVTFRTASSGRFLANQPLARLNCTDTSLAASTTFASGFAGTGSPPGAAARSWRV